MNRYFWILAFYLFVNKMSLSYTVAESRELTQFARSLEATVDISPSLTLVLEGPKLRQNCTNHFDRLGANGKLPPPLLKDPEAVRDMVRCGKFLFLFADFESDVAFPANLVEFGLKIFEEQTGKAFSNYGFYPNPYDPRYPVGMAVLKGNPWGVAAITGKPMGLTCAACHLGKLDDGRYAVGKYNHDLEFGKINAFLMFAPWMASSDRYNEKVWPKSIQTHFEVMKETLEESRLLERGLFDALRIIAWTRMDDTFLKMVKMSIPTPAELDSYLIDRPGVSYASSPLLPVSKEVDGGLEGVSFLLSSPLLWDVENYPGDVEKGTSKPLSTFIPSNNLENFVKAAYIFQTGRREYSVDKYVDPLALYMRTLKGPTVEEKPDKALYGEGSKLFASQCQSCHNGSQGESLRPYPPQDTRTASVYVDPFVNYKPIHDLSARAYDSYVKVLGPISPQKGIYARKLKGIRFRKNLMLSGMVDDLDHAFCLSKSRGAGKQVAPFNDDVHMDLCEGYSKYQKQALVEFLRFWN